MNDLKNSFSDPDILKFTEALNILLNGHESHYTQAIKDLTLLLHKGISEEETQRLLHLVKHNDSLVRNHVLALLANQNTPSATVIDFFRQMTLADRIPDHNNTILILCFFIRNKMTEHLPVIRHLITATQRPGEVYMYALDYVMPHRHLINDLNQLLNDKDLIDALPSASWDYLVYAEGKAGIYGVETEFEESYLKMVQEIIYFLVRYDALIKEATANAGTDRQLFLDLANKKQPVHSFTKALENFAFFHLFYKESRSGFLELRLLVERLQKNKNEGIFFPTKMLDRWTIKLVYY
jgi:hypothetical protein